MSSTMWIQVKRSDMMMLSNAYDSMDQDVLDEATCTFLKAYGFCDDDDEGDAPLSHKSIPPTSYKLLYDKNKEISTEDLGVSIFGRKDVVHNIGGYSFAGAMASFQSFKACYVDGKFKGICPETADARKAFSNLDNGQAVEAGRKLKIDVADWDARSRKVMKYCLIPLMPLVKWELVQDKTIIQLGVGPVFGIDDKKKDANGYSTGENFVGKVFQEYYEKWKLDKALNSIDTSTLLPPAKRKNKAL